MTFESIPVAWQTQNEMSRIAWESNASFWDERMGDDGNANFRELLWPAIGSLLQVEAGQRILDAACGNGVLSRRLADLGAQVVGFDFSERLIELARSRSQGDQRQIDFRVADATNKEELRALGPGPFDALACNMGLMDMPLIAPLLEASLGLLKPGAPLVFSVVHPCFNSAFSSIIAERSTEGGRAVTRYSLRLTDYKSAGVSQGEAIRGQPSSQPYFDRTLEALFSAFFRFGYVLDGLIEPVFNTPADPDAGPSWANLSGIPQSIVVRMRTPTLRAGA